MAPLPVLPGMKNVYLLLRHGHSWANEKHLIVSTMEDGVKSEYGLSRIGVDQAQRAGLQLALMLKKLPHVPVHMVSSPFSRAMETAEHVGEPAGLKPDNIEVMDGLRERFFGKELELTNHAHDWYVSIHAEDEASNGTKRPGGDGESAGDVANRFMDVIKHLESKYAGHIIILSSHGDTCTIGQQALLGKPVSTHSKHPLANCELRYLTETEGHHTHHAVDDLHDDHPHCQFQ